MSQTSSTSRADSPRPSGPSARVAVASELARALGDLALLPFRAVGYLFQRARRERETREDLSTHVPAPVAPELPLLPSRDGRPLRIFLSCAEPSGQIHGANLIDALERLCEQHGAPRPTFVGLGGPELAARGMEIVGDPVSRAAMGFDVVGALPFYLGLLKDAAQRFADEPPDVFLPVDSPALHVPLAHMARRYGVRTVHFITPQYWGWAPWRVGGYRRAVDLALCILPFEVPWFERHGVRAELVGHPLLDELADVDVAPEVPDLSRPPRLALLPGSRRHVVSRNLPWMLQVLGELDLGETRIEIPCATAELESLVRARVAASSLQGRVDVVTGDLHGLLRRATAAFSVSGTVLLDLLHHRLPTVVVYRLGNARQSWASTRFLTVPWFSSPNLLAAKEVFPEFCFHGAGPVAEAAAAVGRALYDEPWRAECVRGLESAAERLGPPGAVERAAGHALRAALGAHRPR